MSGEKRLNSKGHSFAACLSGGLNVLVSYPLELVRTRFQMQILEKRSSTFSTLRNIVKVEGVRGLYSGCALGMIGATIAWASYMYVYTEVKLFYEKEEKLKGHGIDAFQSWPIIVASLTGGICTQIITTPIWLVKTRLQLNSLGDKPHYTGTIDAFKKIYKIEGFLGFYKGLIPSLFTTVHGLVQFFVYEKLTYSISKNSWYKSWNPAENNKSFMSGYLAFFSGFISKICALLVTYPFMTIRTRLQAKDSNHHFIKSISFLLRNEGVFGFYKGISPSLMRLPIHSACFFLFYEKIKQFI